MIKILNEGSFAYPIFVCDVCNKRIDDIGLGAAVSDRSGGDGEIQDVLHVHKGACHEKGDEKLGGIATWKELQDHVILLIVNSGLNPADLTKRLSHVL